MTATEGLHISPELTLPLDAITETFGLLAVRRAGKSNAAVVMAEEMFDNGLPWVAIDPKGDWWGVRAAGDGKAPGLAVLVFGGLHGDVPLEPTAGRMVADLIVEQRLTCVLDVSEMSGADMRRFLTDFAQRLYQKNTEPLHVFCEEADEYIPQQVRNDSTHLVGAFEKLIKRGGFKGIGVTLITQRSASLNKDVLTQVATLIPMRTPSPQDRKAILAWVDVHEAGKEAVEALPSLNAGEAYVFSPQWLDVPLTKIRFRRRRTFDSGATPKVGQVRRAPATLAEVDLAALKEAMAETIEKANATDPKLLLKRVRELEAIKRGLEKQLEEAVPAEAEEVSILTKDDRWLLGEVAGELNVLQLRMNDAKVVLDKIASALNMGNAKTPAPVKRGPTPKPYRLGQDDRTPVDELHRPGDVKLGKTERTVLAVLAEHGGLTLQQIALLAGYSPKASTIPTALSKLRQAGYVNTGQPIQATDAGIEWLGPYDTLPSGAELLEYWRQKFGKTERAVLDAIIDLYPHDATLADVCEATGYSPSASTVPTAASKLRKVGVLEGWSLSEDFARSAGLA